MSARELVVLGTASQVPTRTRNHNGYVLRWDDEVILFDPGEGTQRQMTHAGVSASSLTRICVTHAHGDHCLGLAGVLQRRSLDGATNVLELHYPASAAAYIASLRTASAHRETAPVRECPVEGDGVIAQTARRQLRAASLDHAVDAIGYRLEEAPGRRMLPERLAALGVAGPDIGRLQREGFLAIDGRRLSLDDVSAPRSGQTFAFVMDTRWCDGALELARGADLLVCESTFLESDAALAAEYGHLTARQAGALARDAGVRRLVVTHFSQRYGEDVAPFAAEAAAVFPDVVAARDLDVIQIPRRMPIPQ
jgi:ribonuclease Z